SLSFVIPVLSLFFIFHYLLSLSSIHTFRRRRSPFRSDLTPPPSLCRFLCMSPLFACCRSHGHEAKGFARWCSE
ncbi:hypothetical protein A2U01_0083312, partial [Trifolium medium]|nr:hypothetical protein [Trifolium medium]